MRAAPALRNQLKNLVRTALRTGGLELVRCLDFLERRRLVLLGELEIDVLVDVGANDGYWANAVRDRGFQGRILSLEPASQPFEILQRRAEQDPAWECRRVALSDVDARERLNITAKSYSSSLLPLSPKFEGLDESLVETGTEIVDTRRLDSIVDELVQPGDRLFLKIDVQGSELRVLQGARATLATVVRAVECELSVAPLYDGQPLISDVLAYFCDIGFHLVALEPGFRHPRTGQFLQFNGLFLA